MDDGADEVDVEDGIDINKVKYDGYAKEAESSKARHCAKVNQDTPSAPKSSRAIALPSSKSSLFE